MSTRKKKTTTSRNGKPDRLPPINRKKTDRVIGFFEKVLRHTKGSVNGENIAGKPFLLLPWQKKIIGELFGRLHPDGSRVRRVGYIEVPKKQGKSTLMAGLALYFLTGDNEPAAEIYGAASDREQAGIIYREAAAMVRGSPALSSMLEVIDSRKTIMMRSTNSFYRVLSADAFRAEGLNIHALLFDELHAQKSRALWDALRYGGAARKQPMLCSVTTAGFDRTSICWEQHQYAERVIADPMLDPAFYGCIFSGGSGDPFKESTWKKANPSLGHTVTVESFAADAKEAENTPTKLNSFKRYRLNIWTESATSFIQPQKWMKCVKPHRSYKGRVAYAGLDLSSTTDLSALAVVVADDSDDSIDVFWRVWCPADAIETRSVRDQVDYVGWARDGFIKPTDGDAVDYATIEADVLELFDDLAQNHGCDVKLLGVDPWNATMMSQRLSAQGVNIVNVRQGYGSLSPATKAAETRILNGTIRIEDNKAAHAAAAAVSVQSDHQGNIKPSKAKSKQRIDPIAALINAIVCQQSDTNEPEPDWNIISL